MQRELDRSAVVEGAHGSGSSLEGCVQRLELLGTHGRCEVVASGRELAPRRARDPCAVDTLQQGEDLTHVGLACALEGPRERGTVEDERRADAQLARVEATRRGGQALEQRLYCALACVVAYSRALGGWQQAAVSVDKLHARQAEGVAALADGNGLKDTRVAQLLESEPRLEGARRAGAVGLDAPDEVRVGRLNRADERGELLGELDAHGRLARLGSSASLQGAHGEQCAIGAHREAAGTRCGALRGA